MLGPDVPNPAGSGPSLSVRSRLRFQPVATRSLGTDLLIASSDPATEVSQLGGSGPICWDLLRSGLTIGEAAQQLASATQAPLGEIQAELMNFSVHLMEAGIAELK